MASTRESISRSTFPKSSLYNLGHRKYTHKRGRSQMPAKGLFSTTSMSLARARVRLASVPSTPTKSLRRTYSILSKGVSGRFITAAKVPKALATPGSSTVTSSTNTSSEGQVDASAKGTLTSKAKAPMGDEPAEELTVTESKAKTALSSSTNTSSSSDQDPSSLSSASNTAATSDAPPQSSKSFVQALEPHPRPTKEAISLHSFFSLHRPLLLLPIHTTQPIFTSHSVEGTILDGIRTAQNSPEDAERSDSSQNGPAKAAKPAKKGIYGGNVPRFEVELGSGRPIMSLDGTSVHAQIGDEDVPEADADAARLLGRSYVLSRIGSVVDWQATLSRLGDHVAKEELAEIKAAGDHSEAEAAAAEEQVRMDSVKRKRKKKMNKHIYKKRRKRERAQRRRLGK